MSVSDQFGSFVLRQAVPEDEDFLFMVYAGTRRDEVTAWGWDDRQQEMFLRMQFRAQQFQYEDYDDTGKYIIIKGSIADGQPVGRLIVDRNEKEIHLVDIALLPESRGLGIGTRILNDLIDEARTKGLSLRLEVTKTNRAAELYKRLGFRVKDENETYIKMEWCDQN